MINLSEDSVNIFVGSKMLGGMGKYKIVRNVYIELILLVVARLNGADFLDYCSIFHSL